MDEEPGRRLRRAEDCALVVAVEMGFAIDDRCCLAIDIDGAVIDVGAVALGKTGDDRNAGLRRNRLETLNDCTIGRLGECR
ncbi:hypothetical protein D9M70_531990 [compost metagenome]